MVKHWRATLVALISLMTVVSCSKTKTPFEANWERYLANYYQQGHIQDTGNNNVSHTEGQGYAMLFAVAADDNTTFDALWQWTQSTLQRDDNLFSWQYTPCPANNRECISDTNNATDGDILIAWALLRADDKWSRPVLRKEALAIISAIAQKLIVNYQQHSVLLPGEYGFAKDDTVQINLSYWVYPALQRFLQETRDKVWQHTIDSGLSLMTEARFGESQLNSDWVVLTPNGPTLTGALSADYGYNACRIPLHSAWQFPNNKDAVSPWQTFWQQDPVPATVNLTTDEPAEYAYTIGMQAIQQTVNALTLKPATGDMQFANIDKSTDYFSASLLLLSQLAWLDHHQ